MTPRIESLDRLRSRGTWDLVVIGGGATGLGAAVDAVTRGYRTLLLDAYDFAQATSSRSTKLVHGGVRYLAQGEIGLVREALRERGRLLQNAPHLVHDRAFLIPSYHWWETPYYALGLKAYDQLAGKLGLGHSRTVGKGEALSLAPTVEPRGLKGGVVYYDGQFDDSRLAIALVRTLDDHGGTALNHVGVTGLIKNGSGQISGVRAEDSETGETFEILARCVINATGVFADKVRKIDDAGSKSMIAPSQGAHIVVDRKFLPGVAAILVPKTEDGRVLFAIPWNDHVVIGTTDTPVSQTVLEPRPLAEEIDFLMRHAARYLTKDLIPDDVLSLYAGLRPLIAAGAGANTSKLSRGFATIVSASGLVTITGGKWTTYRRMGEVAVDLAAKTAGLAPRVCVTVNLKLHGATSQAPDRFKSYGADAAAIESLVTERPEWAQRLHTRLPYVAVEVIWAVRNEAARRVEDVLARRTRALLLDARAALEAAPEVASLMAKELGRDTAWRDDQVKRFNELAGGYLMPGSRLAPQNWPAPTRSPSARWPR